MAYTGRPPAAAPLTSGDIPDGSITTADLVDDAVTPAKLSTGSPEWTSGYDFSLYEDTGTTAKFFWDASAESLGIGTSSPTAPLEISGSDYTKVRLNRNDGAGTPAIAFKTNTANNVVIDGGGPDEVLRAYTGGSERMRIDSSGRVTMPYQPMCFVTRTSTQSSISSNEASPTDLVLNTVIFNVGSHFNTSNSRWTAPVTGKYEFSWSYATYTTNPSVYRTYIWVNGTKATYTQLRNDSTGNSSNYNFASRTAILELSAGDYAVLRASIDGTPSTWYADINLRTCLTIRLIA